MQSGTVIWTGFKTKLNIIELFHSSWLGWQGTNIFCCSLSSSVINCRKTQLKTYECWIENVVQKLYFLQYLCKYFYFRLLCWQESCLRIWNSFQGTLLEIINSSSCQSGVYFVGTVKYFKQQVLSSDYSKVVLL